MRQIKSALCSTTRMALAGSLAIATLGMDLTTADVALGQVVAVGGEFQVNSYTSYWQRVSTVGMDGAGHFVVAWHSYDPMAAVPADIVGQRYDSAAAPSGGEIPIGSGQFPDVAVDGTGDFVVVWQGQDISTSGILGRRYDSAGMPLGVQFQVNTFTTSDQDWPRVAVGAAGNFVVAWEGLVQDGSGTGVFARRYDSAGVPLGGEFQVNVYTTGFQEDVEVAMDDAGGFVVTWTSQGQDGSSGGVFARRFDAAGMALGGEFQVNAYTSNFQGIAAVDVDAAGNFVVTWTSSTQDGYGYGIFGQRYDAGGMALGGEFPVNTYTTADQQDSRVVLDDAGAFTVIWASHHQDGSEAGVFGRRFDAAGLPVGGEVQVSVHTTRDQNLPDVATDGAGRFVVTWSSYDQDAPGYGIFARRMAAVGTSSILGRKFLVKDPIGTEDGRTVIALAKETATDIGAAITGNPTIAGATLRVIAQGNVDSDRTYVLDAGGWSPAGTTGFRYTGPTGADGDPVKKVIIRRTAAGVALLKTILKGNVGTDPLDVVPPNPGDSGGVILTINGGGTYCTSFGGAAGGTEVKDTAELWKVVDATGEGCPLP